MSVVRDLGILSKNQCAFPGCNEPLLNHRQEYVGELCHIEAAEPGGPRYNHHQSDEERRSIPNLLFLCHPHHKETDNEALYPVDCLREIKARHEALPAVVFDHDLLMQRVLEIQANQEHLRQFLERNKASLPIQGVFPLVGLHDAWTPDEGRFYAGRSESGSTFKLMMKSGWLHVELTLADGAVFYFEVNEQGSARFAEMPYPINEYHVEIPEGLIQSRERIPSSVGTHAIRTTLKWSLGAVTEHFQEELLAGVDSEARVRIDHRTRTIHVLDMRSA
jgi:hypothetical protein